MSKIFYTKFLKGHEGKIHLSAHSHYFWPDSAFSAYEDYWTLSANESDHKWNTIFSKEIPQAQARISSILNFSNPQRISFAPNTQELTARLISSFYFKDKINFLTTSSELHSFSRQIKRLSEEKEFDVTYIDNEKDDFEKSFLNAISDATNFIFLSHVFYNSGKKISLDFIKKIIKKKHRDSILMIDGYHGFCAVQTDLSEIIEDIYYISGCYKYAQAGEGLCFMTVPMNCRLRPLNTGWFASFSELEDPKSEVTYDNTGYRFASSTLDFSTLFKFNRIWDEFDKENVSYLDIISHSKKMMDQFMSNEAIDFLVDNKLDTIGLFLTYDFKDLTKSIKIQEILEKNFILIDRRSTRIRFSFGFYIDESDVSKAVDVLNQALKEATS